MDITYIVYLDDILIYLADSAEHEGHVKAVLDRLLRYRLYAKISKYRFSIDTMDFLEYVLGPNGLVMEKS